MHVGFENSARGPVKDGVLPDMNLVPVYYTNSKFRGLVPAENSQETRVGPPTRPTARGRHNAAAVGSWSGAPHGAPPVGLHEAGLGAVESDDAPMPDSGQFHVKQPRSSQECTTGPRKAARGAVFGDRPPGLRILYRKIRLGVNGQPIWRSWPAERLVCIRELSLT